jgi:hypothetical protein
MEPTTSPTATPALASFEDKQHNVCVAGNTMMFMYDSTPESCAQACLDDWLGFCLGIEYFYEFGRCNLKSSTNTEGCDGEYLKIDWYKRKMGGEDESLLEFGDGSAFDEMYE